MPEELTWQKDIRIKEKTAARRPVLRRDAEAQGVQMARAAKIGNIAAFYVHSEEAWMLGEILPPQEACDRWGHGPAKVPENTTGAVQVVSCLYVVSHVVVHTNLLWLHLPQIVQGDVPEALNWMGKLKDDDEVVYVYKLEAKPQRSGERREFTYAVDATGAPKKFACFAGDTRVADVNVTKKVVELRRGRRSNAQQSAPETKTTFLLNSDERARILSVLPTAD